MPKQRLRLSQQDDWTGKMAVNANKVENNVQLALDLFGLDPLVDRDFTHTLSLYDVVGK